jgi:hypothetical protein
MQFCNLFNLKHFVKVNLTQEFWSAAGLAQSRTSKVSSEAVSSAGSFQSHLPRPLTVGRSASSGSSTGGGGAAAPPDQEAHSPRQRARKSLSIESLNNTNDEEENLLADCIFSGEELCYRVADPDHLNGDPDPTSLL